MCQRFDGIFLSQGKYAVDVLRRFEMMECKSMATLMVSNLKNLHDTTSSAYLVDSRIYRQRIGLFLYLVHTRPDICFAVTTLSQFMSDPRHVHWVVAKHVLRYLHGMIGYGPFDGVKIPCNKGGHCSFLKSQLDSQT